MVMTDPPEMVQRIRAHGGLARIHVTPFCKDGDVIGWQNVYVCKDGARFGLSPAEEVEAMPYSLNPEPLLPEKESVDDCP